jgi:uncharacterized protein YdhG (YjbR/CyaY superfamily)
VWSVLVADVEFSAMRGDASTVDEYIAAAPAARRRSLAHLRQLCTGELRDFEEAVRSGMPSYLRDGEVEIAFAAQEAHISFSVLRQDALEANAARLEGLSLGKGCIRFRRSDQIDPDTIRALLGSTAASAGPIC